ncbi:MAG TPA: hypothetical protein VFJ51_12180 [Nitrososphaeraceae archaeon]|nr:hypothetical protein [Nitrososphaeraceae archaeon]
MTNIAEKVKDKLKDAKDTVVGSKEDTEGTGYDSTKRYESNEPMSAAKIKEHEPTAVKREMTENITEGETVTSTTEEAREKARRSGMTKGTAGSE